ncbi:GNAT family N-acetyltransferase [Anaerococcus hydrogenalis]|nr:GNAT family N-acetyltransferase [Anaerococcus hydrogenalis]
MYIKKTSVYTIEIFVMGVLKKYHRNHIGRNLFKESIEILKNYEYEFVQVKTLKEGIDYGYDKTNKFYQALGFRKFEVIDEIWSKDNPCQIYVKSIV